MAADDLVCPVCAAELPLVQLFSHAETRQAFAALARISTPLGARMLAYVALFAPAKNRQTLARKAKLVQELLPDLQRNAITRKGRDWLAPLPVWIDAIDQLLGLRDQRKLSLPLSSHGYLYEVICTLSDRAEAQAEQQREQERRGGARTDVVQLRSQTMGIGAALQAAYAGKEDASLAALAARDRQAAPMPNDVRAKLIELRNKTKPTPANQSKECNE